MEKFQKVWFISGASRGFGFEIAKAALASGDRIVAAVRHAPEQVSARLNNAPGLLVVQLDVTNETEVRSGVQQAVDQFGRIDVVVNNAGYGIVTAIEEASDAEAKKLYDTNVFGLLNLTRAVLPFLRRQRSGHIINVSSLFGYDAIPGWALYGSTKFAVEGLSKGLAVELAPFGIYMTAIAPGLFSTDFLSADSYVASAHPIDDYKETAVWHMRQGASQLHGKQPGDPKKLAAVVVKLAHLEKPPVHLPIGEDSVAMYRNNAAKTLAEIAQWKELSFGTGHEQAIKQEKQNEHAQ
jgi:NAD(P)-dependent dehydrogenase (short-subunit alcohol dehydrogenase family)